jgi:hypothetical protein
LKNETRIGPSAKYRLEKSDDDHRKSKKGRSQGIKEELQGGKGRIALYRWRKERIEEVVKKQDIQVVRRMSKIGQPCILQ